MVILPRPADFQFETAIEQHDDGHERKCLSTMRSFRVLRASVVRFVRPLTSNQAMSQGSDVSTARRLVFVGSNVEPCLIQEEVPIPKLKSGEILGKFRMATICGSDLHTISGRRKEAVPRFVYSKFI